MHTLIQRFNTLCDDLGERWSPFAQTRIGKIFLNLVLLGPVSFLPTLWEAWTAPNIDVLRTLTWPFLFVINLSALYGLLLQGTWQNRLMLGIWTGIMFVMTLAILVR